MQNMSDPKELRFPDAGPVPNNPRLPVLYYKAAIRLGGDPPADIERVFQEMAGRRNGATAFIPFITIIRPRMRRSASRAARPR